MIENLHQQLWNHKPASTILKTLTHYLYSPTMSKLVEEVSKGCGICTLENGVRTSQEVRDRIIYDGLKPGEVLAVD